MIFSSRITFHASHQSKFWDHLKFETPLRKMGHIPVVLEDWKVGRLKFSQPSNLPAFQEPILFNFKAITAARPIGVKHGVYYPYKLIDGQILIRTQMNADKR